VRLFLQENWCADKIERRSIASLTPYPRTARTHSDEQIGQVAASDPGVGWTIPILVKAALRETPKRIALREIGETFVLP